MPELSTPVKPWITVGTFTAADTTPGDNARDYASVKALTNTAIYGRSEQDNAIEIRFTGDTDADSIVYDVFVASDATDYFTRIATLTLTVGTQQKGSAAVLFCDTIVKTNEKWFDTIRTVDADGGDRIARVFLDLYGYGLIAFVPTTIPANSSNTVEVRGV